MREQNIETPVGRARVDWFPAEGHHRGTAVLGHGTATGVEAADLQALARALPKIGCLVGLVTQPYRVESNPSASGERSLDLAWTAIWPEVTVVAGAKPLISGGRSAGAQVACRTSEMLSVDAGRNFYKPCNRTWDGRRPPSATIGSRTSATWLVGGAMATHVVTSEAVAKWAVRSTKASARLERRDVPADFVRSPEAARFLAERRQRKA